jgi:SAM-dependent methyltransferase
MVYRVTGEESIASQDEYKKNYKPFRPFKVTAQAATHVARGFDNLVSTQNGQDTDDYVVGDNNPVERYLSDYTVGTRVLLLGVGTGREVMAAKAIGLDAVGITLGSRNTDYAYDYLGLTKEEVFECLTEALPYDPDTFDVVAGFQIFEHTISPLMFLLEQRRVLKPGGKLLLEWPPAEGFHMDDNPHHQVCFTPGQAYMLFRKAGFDNIKLYYDDHSVIPEDDWWRADQNKMLVIEGVKGPARKDYIQRLQQVQGVK